MSKALVISLSIVIAASNFAAAAETWTDSSGAYQVVAEFVALEGDMIVLKREDGPIIRVPLNRLSDRNKRLAEQLSMSATNKTDQTTIIAGSPLKRAPDSTEIAVESHQATPSTNSPLSMVDAVSGIDLVRRTTGRFFGFLSQPSGGGLASKFQLAADSLTVWTEAGRESGTGATLDTIVEHVFAGADVILAKVNRDEEVLPFSHTHQMAAIAMACHLLIKDGGPKERRSYEALVSEILEGMGPIASELEKDRKLVSDGNLFGMAAMAMACHLLTKDGNAETGESYQQLVAKILAGTRPILSKADQDGKNIQHNDVFGMAAMGMACHLLMKDGSSETQDSYQQLVVEILAGMQPILSKAEQDGKRFRYGDVFSMAAMGMACHLLTNESRTKSAGAYQSLLDDILASVSPIISVAKKEGRKVSYKDAFCMAVQAKIACYVLSPDTAPDEAVKEYNELLGTLQRHASTELSRADDENRAMNYKTAFDAALRDMLGGKASAQHD